MIELGDRNSRKRYGDVLTCRRTLAIALLLAVLLSACDAHRLSAPTAVIGGPAPSALPHPSLSPSSTVGSPTTVSLSGSCDKTTIMPVVEQFVAAFNQGAPGQLARFFGPRFLVYEVGEGDPGAGGRRFIAYGPQERGSVVASDNVTAVPSTDLLPYFAARHAHSERLEIQALDGRYEATEDRFIFTFRFVRTADDLPPGLGGPGHLAYGKGAISCADRTIITWTMSQDQDHPGV